MKYLNLHKDVKTKQKGGKIEQRNMILICISQRTLFMEENKRDETCIINKIYCGICFYNKNLKR